MWVYRIVMRKQHDDKSECPWKQWLPMVHFSALSKCSGRTPGWACRVADSVSWIRISLAQLPGRNDSGWCTRFMRQRPWPTVFVHCMWLLRDTANSVAGRSWGRLARCPIGGGCVICADDVSFAHPGDRRNTLPPQFAVNRCERDVESTRHCGQPRRCVWRVPIQVDQHSKKTC